MTPHDSAVRQSGEGKGNVGTGTEGAQAATLRDYLNVARRRKWIIVAAVVLVPLAAIAYSLHQPKLYQASAQVLLSSQNLAAELTGTQTGTSAPDRVAQTQADLAGTPAVAALTLHRVPGSGLTPAGFLGAATVSTATNADLLTFGVSNRDPVLAQKLVNAYASAYTLYRRELDTSAIKHALTGVDKRIAQLARANGTKSALYASLVERQQTLETMQALQTSNASVVKEADGASQTQPRTKRNAILGLMLGLVLGLGLAFLRESLDTRVRSAEEIAERLGGLPLLARVPEPDKKLRAERRLVMLRNSSGTQAETFRMLRTNLEFATLGRDVRTIMITSAVEQEGKSTTIANLAIALARAGKRVVLVDLDLRRPFLDKFFDLGGPGVTQVALGHATLERALVPLAVGGSAVLAARSNGNGTERQRPRRGGGRARGAPIRADPARPGRVRRHGGAVGDPRGAARARRRRPGRRAAAAARRRRGDAEHEGGRDRGRDPAERRPPAHAARAAPAARSAADAGARLRPHRRGRGGQYGLRVRLRVPPAPLPAARVARTRQDGVVSRAALLALPSPSRSEGR